MFLETIFTIYQQINYLDLKDVKIYHLFIILKNTITLNDSFITALIILYNEIIYNLSNKISLFRCYCL